MTATLALKRLELIRELLPQNSTVGFLVNPDNQDILQEIKDVARSTGRSMAAMEGSTRDFLAALRRASTSSSSVPIRRLYPAT
jgi:ABC-type uncharacterized transport system substrate-binding protein